MDALSPRQQQILELVDRVGFVTIEALAESFKVSAQTIRREIITLDSKGILQRFHGGAGRANGTDKLRLGHEYKSQQEHLEKEIIAKQVTQHIASGDTLYIDVGTTMERVAQELNKFDQLTILTNSILVATKFDHARHSVNVLGGEIAGQDGSLVGEQAVQQLRNLRLDHALIGCSAIEPDGSVMDFDQRKIAIKQAAKSVSRHSYLLASQHKFGRTAFARICHMDEFTTVISNTGKGIITATG
ncbi:DeoR/GlpR family DNA-binding transcription regulator [Cohaesibacter celericrescens]